jgi:hypothetical protein
MVQNPHGNPHGNTHEPNPHGLKPSWKNTPHVFKPSWNQPSCPTTHALKTCFLPPSGVCMSQRPHHAPCELAHQTDAATPPS